MSKPKRIFRNTAKNKYTVVVNTLLEDTRLSFKATGLACYLLSKPDHWEISVEHLVKQKKDKEASVRSGLKELMEFGYVKRNRITDDFGKVIKWEYVMYEVPLCDFPHVENPDVEKPHVENQGQVITDTKQLLKEVNTETTSGSSSDENLVRETLNSIGYKASEGTIKNLEKLTPSPSRLTEVIEYAKYNNKGPGFIVKAIKDNYDINPAKSLNITKPKAIKAIKEITNNIVDEFDNGICTSPVKKFDKLLKPYSSEFPETVMEYRSKLLDYIAS